MNTVAKMNVPVWTSCIPQPDSPGVHHISDASEAAEVALTGPVITNPPRANATTNAETRFQSPICRSFCLTVAQGPRLTLDWLKVSDHNYSVIPVALPGLDLPQSSWDCHLRAGNSKGAALRTLRQRAPGFQQLSWRVAATTDNGLGMASVGHGLRVPPVRVLGKCGGYDADTMAGMRWAALIAVPGIPADANQARVPNLSLGGDAACNAEYADAVSDGTVPDSVIVAAGGKSRD